MVPKEKAYDLMIKYFKLSYCNDTKERHYNAKDCALIAVAELLGDIDDSILHPQNKEAIDYWQNVKKELEKL